MIKFLSSLKLSAILIICLVLMFLAGVFMSLSDPIYDALKQMNDIIILDWVLLIKTNNTAIVIWFVVFCVIAGLLGINLVLCTWNNLLKNAIKSRSVKVLSLFLIHLVFIVILVLHAFSMVIGFKYGNIRLSEDDRYKFENEYELVVSDIDFIDDYSILKKSKSSSRMVMTRDKFHYKENSAELTIYNKGKEISKDNVKIFEPIVVDGIQFTMENFFLDEKSGNIGIKLTIAKNPLTIWFFIFYGLGILSMLWFLILTWKKK